jgi:DNA-binding NarL/FixJ family response regulator
MAHAKEPKVTATGGRRIIERPRLLKLLDETTARTILLIAPAGYGKTTLARQWSRDQQKCVWYAARAGSADLAQLVVGLSASLEETIPGLHEYVLQLVRALPNPAHNAAEVVDGFAKATVDLAAITLIVDDYQVIAESETAATLLDDLQRRLGFRLLVASRLRPAWATARLQMYGELLELGSEELALTDEEAMEVLGRSSGQMVDLVERARGWPAVVGLAAQTDTRSLSPDDSAASTLFRFFAEELFLATPLDLQEKLITLALLPKLSKELVEGSLGTDPQTVIDQAVESGLATPGLDLAELHPLVREYLLSKLGTQKNGLDRIKSAFQLSLEHSYWDHAFELIERFNAFELLDPLIEHSFKPLVSSGRIATLERMVLFAHVSGSHRSPAVDLIDAELALRNGRFARAEAIASRAARQLGDTHLLTSHAWWIAGMGAELMFDDPRASRHFQSSREVARADDDLGDALWGLVMASMQAEAPSAADAVKQLVDRRDRSPVDLIRAATAQFHVWRLGIRSQDIDVDGAIHALDSVADPRIRTGFMNQYAYNMILTGLYDAAHDMAEAMWQVVDAYQLTWARPHAEWAFAASALGRRQFGVADMWLRRVETTADQLQYGQLVLNASCVRCRMLLALQRPREALSALNVDETLPANRAMRGEFLATKALVLAVQEPSEQCIELAHEAETLTKSVEAHAYAACSRAIWALRNGGSDADVMNSLAIADQLGVWDPFVSAARGWPPLVAALFEIGSGRAALVTVLRKSNDYDLARQLGIDLGSRPRHPHTSGKLSPREGEVLELVRQGYTNADIARALFISESTVKVHVRHILEKTGARSRTQAATTVDVDR